MPLRNFIFFVFLILQLYYVSAENEVVGSLIVRCNEPILYSKLGVDARFTSEFINSFGKSKLQWEESNRIKCPQNVEEITEICQEYYGPSKSAIRGPSMFPIVMGSRVELVRPIFCLNSTYYNPSILSPSGCVFRVLSSDNFKRPSEMETLAVQSCDQVEMQLYQSMPLIFNNDSYLSIEYVCCPKIEKKNSNWNPKLDPFGVKIPLSRYDDFYTFYSDNNMNGISVLEEKYKVIGSFIVNCNEYIAHTRFGDYARIDSKNSLSYNWIKNRDLIEIKKCSSINEVWYANICKNIYTEARILKAIAGPTNIRIPFDKNNIFRPVWCLAGDLEQNEPLIVDKDCLENNYGNNFCLSQDEIENVARKECLSDSILQSAFPMVSCPDSAWLAGGYQKLKFTCCKKANSEELLKVKELKKFSNSQRNFLKESTINSLRISYDRIKKHLEKETNEQAKLMVDRFIQNLIQSHEIDDDRKSERQEIKEFNEALSDLTLAFKAEEKSWAEIEEDEFHEIENSLKLYEKSSDEEIQYGLDKETLDNEGLQRGLSHLLLALNDVVNENLRHLRSIESNQPWRFLPINVSRENYSTEDKSKFWDSPIFLTDVHHHILSFVNHARDRILLLRKIFWRLSGSSTPKFLPELTNSYDTLQTTLKRAIEFIDELNKLAQKLHPTGIPSREEIENVFKKEFQRKHLSPMSIMYQKFKEITGIQNGDAFSNSQDIDNGASEKMIILIKVLWILGIVMAVVFSIIFVFLLIKKFSHHIKKSHKTYHRCDDLDFPPEYTHSKNSSTKSQNDINDILKRINDTRIQHKLQRSESNNYLYGNESKAVYQQQMKGVENPIFQHYNS